MLALPVGRLKGREKATPVMISMVKGNNVRMARLILGKALTGISVFR